MGRYKILLTRQELKAKLGYKLSDPALSKLQYGQLKGKCSYPPIIKEGIDWYESKLGNVFYYCSAFKKLKIYLDRKEKE